MGGNKPLKGQQCSLKQHIISHSIDKKSQWISLATNIFNITSYRKLDRSVLVFDVILREVGACLCKNILHLCSKLGYVRQG